MEYQREEDNFVELKDTVAEKRKYRVLNVEDARKATTAWLENVDLAEAVSFGLPEVDDRYHVWRVPLLGRDSQARIGEVVIDAYSSLILQNKSTSPDVLESRLLHRKKVKKKSSLKKKNYRPSNLRNTIALGDAEKVLRDFPEESVDLIFTSPPYFNARPEYEDYVTYEEYLLKMQKVIRACHRVLNEGRFFVMNISPYSFVDDVVLDPFAGSGTVGLASTKLKRRFVLVDKAPKYVNLMRERAKSWLGKQASDILCVNCAPITVDDLLI